MPEIILEENDRLDWALKTFKRRMQTSGILRELRRRQSYMKPSVARVMKLKAAKRARDKAKRGRRSPS